MTLSRSICHLGAVLLAAGSLIRAGELPEVVILIIGNDSALSSNPTEPAVFTTAREWRITRISTDHTNGASGATPGTISLSEAGGATYGPFAATGRDAGNLVWDASPDVVLPAGTYTVVDSNPATWSQNTGSGGRGFVIVKGRPQFDLPYGGTLVSSVIYSVNGDPRITPVIWTAPSPAGVVDAQITVPGSALQSGRNSLSFGAIAQGETDSGPWVTSYVQRLPSDGYRIGSLAIAVNRDPAEGADDTNTIDPPSTVADAVMTFPSGLTRFGLNHLYLRARDPGGFWGPLVIAPMVSEVGDPLPAAGRISGFEMKVLDAVGNPQAGPITAAVTPPALPFDGIATWPNLRLRSSGDYRMIVAAITEGFPVERGDWGCRTGGCANLQSRWHRNRHDPNSQADREREVFRTPSGEPGALKCGFPGFVAGDTGSSRSWREMPLLSRRT